MRQIATASLCALAVSVTFAAPSRFDWSHYDPAKPVTLSGKLWIAENIDGYVVIRINLRPDHPTDLWTVVLGTPKELKEAGLPLELRLGNPTEAVVWLRKDGNPKHGRAQAISLNAGPRVTLRSN